MSKPTDLVQGTLDLLILRVVALEPMHGWAIAQRIRQMSNEQLRVGQSALYPALHKLEQQGWIEAEWGSEREQSPRQVLPLTREPAVKLMKAEAGAVGTPSAAISLVVQPA